MTLEDTKDDGFRGVWISRELMDDQRLTPFEKMVVGYSQSFGEGRKCRASDAHIAKRLGVAEKTVSNCLSRLRKKGIMTGRDFPKQGTPVGGGLPYSGNSTSLIREHRSKGEQSKNTEREKGPGFDFRKPEDFPRILPLLADWRFGEEELRRAWGQIAAEVSAGTGQEIRNEVVYLAGRVERNRAAAAREARRNGEAPKREYVSQFSKTYN